MAKDINNLVITRTNPLLIVFMLDQSSSMSEKFGNGDFSKAKALSNAINNVLYEIGLKSVKDGEIVSRFEIGLFAYGNDAIRTGWEGSLANKYLHTIKNIFNNPLKATEDAPLEWITPQSNGGTPMYAAFKNVKDLLEDWINWGNHKEACHPPIVINISDGEATDDNDRFSGIKAVANEIKNLKTDYGNTIIMNIHISGQNHDRILFPDTPVGNSPYQSLLFEISSPLYKRIIDKAKEVGYDIRNDARGYVYNGDSSNLIHFLNIGTQAVGERVMS